eukprot:TRINITY_DN25115_c0_g1_i1.p1 TRINITY_DN25115_c0_g1~~TRINITY_DN25115_c0_g1_i1.p1  ORF type:complete len:497 (+),score=219.91 TRINITY_DN25115_c0_g1_i1:55-1545(+)
MADIFQLCEDGSVEKVEELLAKSPLTINDYNKQGVTPMTIAIQNKNHNLVKRLLKYDADPNARSTSGAGTYQGYTPMHFAAKADDDVLLQMLFERGGSPKLQGKDGWTPLHVACFSNCKDAVKWLLEKKVDVNVKNDQGTPALVTCVAKGTTHTMRMILKNTSSKPKLDFKDSLGDTLMHHALHTSMHRLFEGSYTLPDIQIDVACMLALAGVDPEAPGAEGMVATHYVKKTFGSDNFTQLLKLLHMNREHIMKSEGTVTEYWNYMTLLAVKQRQVWENMGVHGQQAKAIVDIIHTVEEERKKRNEPKKNENARKPRTAPLQKVGDESSSEESDDDDDGVVVKAPAAAAQPKPPAKVPEKKAAEAAPAPEKKPTPAPPAAKPTPAAKPAAPVKPAAPAPSPPAAAATPAPAPARQPVVYAAPSAAPYYPPPPVAPSVEKRVETTVEKVVEVKWQHPSDLPPPALNWAWAYHNRTAILCCIISFLLGNSFAIMRAAA